MSVQVEKEQAGKVIEIHVEGKLSKEDYDQFVPQVEGLIQQHGKLRLLVDLHDFHGWEASALWEDIKFDVKHFRDFDKLAIVGEKRWERGMAAFCKPFTTATVRYFNRDEAQRAHEWIHEPV